jgi:AMP nucleosidase
MITKQHLVEDWLPRYTGMPLDKFGDYVLLTNFRTYINRFSEKFGCQVHGADRPMQAATNDGEGTSDDYLPPQVPALPSFKLHKFVSEKLVERHLDYRTGVVYTTNRRVWEHDEMFKNQLAEYSPIAIDMETATIFVVGHKNQIARGALLLVSDLPMTPEGVKTQKSDQKVSQDWSDVHLEIGIESLTDIDEKGEQIKHFQY